MAHSTFIPKDFTPETIKEKTIALTSKMLQGYKNYDAKAKDKKSSLFGLFKYPLSYDKDVSAEMKKITAELSELKESSTSNERVRDIRSNALYRLACIQSKLKHEIEVALLDDKASPDSWYFAGGADGGEYTAEQFLEQAQDAESSLRSCFLSNDTMILQYWNAVPDYTMDSKLVHTLTKLVSLELTLMSEEAPLPVPKPPQGSLNGR